jgi:hypothetical protein
MITHEKHVDPTPVQLSHFTAARTNKNQFASQNHGRPAVLAVPDI